MIFLIDMGVIMVFVESFMSIFWVVLCIYVEYYENFIVKLFNFGLLFCFVFWLKMMKFVFYVCFLFVWIKRWERLKLKWNFLFCE